MNYFAAQRQSFIATKLKKVGHINREDIAKKFKIGESTATRDLTRFRDLNPNAVEYNVTAKRYEKKQ